MNLRTLQKRVTERASLAHGWDAIGKRIAAAERTWCRDVAEIAAEIPPSRKPGDDLDRPWPETQLAVRSIARRQIFGKFRHLIQGACARRNGAFSIMDEGGRHSHGRRGRPRGHRRAEGRKGVEDLARELPCRAQT